LDLRTQFEGIKALIEKDYWGEIISGTTLFENLVSAINCSTVNFFGVNHDVVRQAPIGLEEPSSVYLLVHIDDLEEPRDSEVGSRTTSAANVTGDGLCQGRTIWIVDYHRGNGKRFVVHAEEKLTTFLELEAAVRSSKR